jgi:hypothetical protein
VPLVGVTFIRPFVLKGSSGAERCLGLPSSPMKTPTRASSLAERKRPEPSVPLYFKPTLRKALELGEWLTATGCTQAAIEATGVYWKPVWQVLADGAFELMLANASHVKNVPGRKTDVNGRASAPTRTQVRGKGAIAVAAQATTENKLKVTAIEIRPAKKR